MTSLASPQKQHFATQKFANYKEEVERERVERNVLCTRLGSGGYIRSLLSGEWAAGSANDVSLEATWSLVDSNTGERANKKKQAQVMSL
jgi:hypothetical protein